MMDWFHIEDINDELIEWDEDYQQASSDDEECMDICMKPFECADTPFEWCQMTECHNSCEDHHTCYAEWTNKQGKFEAGECEHYWEQHECVEYGMDEMPDQCEYTECDMDCEGECWVEECNMEDECKPETCTRWEFVAEENYWSAIDCTPEKKDFDNFHHFFQVAEHFEDSWNAL